MTLPARQHLPRAPATLSPTAGTQDAARNLQRGEREGAMQMCFDGDRLYLVEGSPGGIADRDWPKSRRIFVLTPEGRTLQVYSQKSWLRAGVGSDGRTSHERNICAITPWGKKLLVGIKHLKFFLLERGSDNWIDHSIEVLDGL